MMELNESLKRIIDKYPNLETATRGLPDLGNGYNNEGFSYETNKIYNLFKVYGNELYQLLDDEMKDIPTKSLGGGSPMKTKPFPLCQKKLIEQITEENFSEYPMAAGDDYSREVIADYFKSQGVNKVNKNNIIFTISSTHAFGLISEIIARPKDVILMTGPNYGLFTFVPERQSNATIEILPLSLEDNWYVNPKKLAAKIDEINKKLAVEYKDKLDYIPKVVAFLNENPHNPLGKVMNEKNENILKGIGEVCLNKGVFVIDDIIYRDTTYDRNNLSKPIGSYDKYFSNTITITGLSKSYGMASIRSGMVMADEIIIRGIRNKIFQTMDSMPVLQSKALEGAFNTSKEREIEYKKYFDPIIKEYKYRYQLMKAMISGIDSIDNKEVRLLVEKEIRKTLLNDYNLNNILEGIPNVDFVKNTTPEAGFFELIDYTNLKYKETEKHSYITNELDLLKYMYEEQKIKLILGGSISWPNEDELIGRITTALPRDEIINNLGAMNKCLRKLR